MAYQSQKYQGRHRMHVVNDRHACQVNPPLRKACTWNASHAPMKDAVASHATAKTDPPTRIMTNARYQAGHQTRHQQECLPWHATTKPATAEAMAFCLPPTEGVASREAGTSFCLFPKKEFEQGDPKVSNGWRAEFSTSHSVKFASSHSQ